MRLRGGHAVAALVMLASASCRREQIVSGVSDSTFVASMAELRRIQNDPSLDSARRKTARDSVLQRRGLTPADLERAARALADDPDRAGALFQAIEGKSHLPPDALASPPPGARVPSPTPGR